MRFSKLFNGGLMITALALCGPLAVGQTNRSGVTTEARSDTQQLQRGKYLVLLSHCNNCHTAGYAAAQGNMSEDRWLMGNPVGWRGKNGTTYAINLRLYMQSVSEEGWLEVAHKVQSRPPMPWWTLRDTSDADLKAMYRYIRSLGPAGQPAPAFLAPDQTPKPPYNQLPDMSMMP